MDQSKLKPVVFVQGTKGFYAKNSYAQNLLLKAMSRGVTDPNELRKLAGLKATADVFRTLDKMAIRREYHAALDRNNITLDTIVDGISKIATVEAGDDKVKLAAYNVLLKSLGLDKYENVEDDSKGWEQAVLEAINKKDNNGAVADESIIEENPSDIEVKAELVDDYAVDIPVMPDSESKQRGDEAEMAKALYE